MNKDIIFSLIFTLLLISNTTQANPTPLHEKLDSLVNEQAYQQALEILQLQLDDLLSDNQVDSLEAYVCLSGKINFELFGLSEGQKEAEKIIRIMKDSNASATAVHNALINLMHFLDEHAMVQKSYEATLEAANIALSTPGFPVLEAGNTLYFSGAGALALGNYQNARKHFSQALSFFLRDTLAAKNRLPDAYNAMGAMMWSETKLDSAEYYYAKSIRAIQQSDKDSLERFYLSAVTMSNIGLIQQSKGETSAAIQTLEKTLQLYNRVIRNSDDDNLVSKSMRYRLNALSSLAIVHNNLGNYQLSNVFLRSVLDLQKEISPPADPAIFKAMINAGESEMSLREYPKARKTFQMALEQIDQIPGDHLYWKAIATASLAQTEEVIGNDSIALVLFEESKTLFNNALGDAFDRQYLHLMGQKSKFLSKQGKYERALQEAETIVNYLIRNSEKQNPLFTQHKLNIAAIYLQKGDPLAALEEASEVLEFIQQRTEISKSVEERMQMQLYKPQAILLKNKASYQMHQQSDTLFLLNLLKELQYADSLLNNRRIMFPQKENVNALIDENREFYQWMKHVTVQLYMLTGNKKYLNSLIDLKEQSIYNNIRLEFFRRNDITFHNIPDSVIQRENNLLSVTTSDMNHKDQKSNVKAKTSEYFSKWEEYLSMLRYSYPEYYNLRFGKVFNTVEKLQNNMRSGSTVVRYIFIENKLHAFVITKDQTDHFNLGQVNITDSIALLNTFLPEKREILILELLHKQLWKPLEAKIQTQHVIIIPDGTLFNLSFASLPTSPVSSYKELSQNSLIQKHYLSYDFALTLQTPGQDSKEDHSGKYIAFVPGFSNELKEKHKKSISESEDNIYMELLHQPFIIETAKYVRSNYGGRVLTGESSTKSDFLKNAAGHTIMHIGTHAEISNISPAFSRLFFTKTSENPGNLLFAWEIYNHHFANHLTILTACDTGKPTYHPGEGMTSLAHAFHYAGSKSLLMSLWKIDEQSSSMITQKFFDHLAKGHNKAQALSLAKADYLENAKGRTLAPVYWAGIVITGDNSPVEIKRKKWYGFRLWGFALLFIIGLSIRAAIIRKN